MSVQDLLTRALGAVGVLGFTWLCARWVVGALAFALDRTSLDRLIGRLLLRLAPWVVWVLGVVAALQVLALDALSQAIAALLAAAVVGVGLGLKGYLSDLAAGALLLTTRPFGAGDRVLLGGRGGVIEELGLFFTRVHSDDGNTLWVPNSAIASQTIENISLRGTRRVSEVLLLPLNSAVEAWQGALLAHLHADPRVLAEPAPAVVVGALALDRLELHITAWTRNEDHAAVGAALRARAWALRLDPTKDITSPTSDPGERDDG